MRERETRGGGLNERGRLKGAGYGGGKSGVARGAGGEVDSEGEARP